jgi:hypothetical protein
MYKPKYYYFDEIYFETIVFDDTTDVTIFGFVNDKEKDELFGCDFICQFSVLYDILFLSGNDGEILMNEISEKLSHDLEIPTEIDVVETLEDPLLIDNLIFKVYKTHEQDEFGEWKESKDSCYFIDEVIDESKRDETTNRITDEILDAALVNLKSDEERFNEHMLLLNNGYKYYLQLIAKDFTEKEARRMSGLKNELLFRIAHYYYNIKQNEK